MHSFWQSFNEIEDTFGLTSQDQEDSIVWLSGQSVGRKPISFGGAGSNPVTMSLLQRCYPPLLLHVGPHGSRLVSSIPFAREQERREGKKTLFIQKSIG